MQRFSGFGLAKHALSHHENWQRMWRNPTPKKEYDVIIVGGGGHGLATAYYLAKEHGITNVAVIEKGWLGGGNTARNTTIVRSNYLWDEAAHLYEHSMKLWEGLSQDLNYNVMFSSRGVYHLCHTLHDLREGERLVHANLLNGIPNEMLDKDQVAREIPALNCGKNARYPVMGATVQRRGGVARHDAVAWGFARGADALGVDLIQQTEVIGFRQSNGVIEGVETTRGFIAAPVVGCVTAGNSGVMAQQAGFRLPLESHPLQALVSEPIKPVLDCVVMSNHVHGYVSQSDKGDLVIGAGIDGYNGYGQRGSYNTIEHTLSAIVEMFPVFSRVRMNRQWGGIVDTCPDACPIISATPVKGLFFNCGWGTGGFKATPGSGNVFAATLAKREAHPLAKPFSMDRFYSGALIDEHGAAGVAH
ncbi:sarcosine oxidase subunit beta [Pokkaliibacter plantistimulans]|uniref:Sarcosine oxidase subunit beta n=2 Tax=Pseudomonadota TaxID=1224 RepID=A0ABX5M0D2_9GAMM|nr:sarcosine oxidase subunit beta family protein [Pokkaliibacter plantistimulans]PPC74615.1 sarcosine oxidase subunit beta [Pokkaliibacter plantistimulans]PXF31952.1 sarcosine oxidase subunit beta [Pokkaliibacter plantistimulans]